MRIILPRPRRFIGDIWEGVKGSLHSPQKIAGGMLLAVLVYTLFILSTFPEYSWQLLTSDISYLGEIFVALNTNLYATMGVPGLVFMMFYSALTSVVLIHIGIQIRIGGVNLDMAGAGGILPVFFLGGCAGCGAGLVGLLGAAGAMTFLPFQGNGVRLLGALFLIGFLGYYGDPRTCSLDMK